MNMNIQNDSLKSTIPMTGVIVMIAALLTISGCAANRFGMNNDEQQGSGAHTSIHKDAIMEYRIGPADVLSISVWNHKEMDQTVTVRPDGHISFPLTGDVQAVGLTPNTTVLVISPHSPVAATRTLQQRSGDSACQTEAARGDRRRFMALHRPQPRAGGSRWVREAL
jgi:hypothetical protein